MCRLTTVSQQRITRSTRGVDQSLVVGVLEKTRLRDGQLKVHIPIGSVIVRINDIREIEVSRTRGTNTVLRAFDSDGMDSFLFYLAPIGFLTIFIYQTDLR